MATERQRKAAKKNVEKAQSGARKKKILSKLSSQTRRDLGREGAKAAARKRGDSKGTGSGAGAMTVQGAADPRGGTETPARLLTRNVWRVPLQVIRPGKRSHTRRCFTRPPRPSRWAAT